MSKDRSSFLSRLTSQVRNFLLVIVAGLALVWILVKWIAEHFTDILFIVLGYGALAALAFFFFKALYLLIFKAPPIERRTWWAQYVRLPAISFLAIGLIEFTRANRDPDFLGRASITSIHDLYYWFPFSFY